MIEDSFAIHHISLVVSYASSACHDIVMFDGIIPKYGLKVLGIGSIWFEDHLDEVLQGCFIMEVANINRLYSRPIVRSLRGRNLHWYTKLHSLHIIIKKPHNNNHIHLIDLVQLE
jgi:hypothetical protein